MPTTRSYADGCGIARALDVVGERWALLVVRELLFGPARFADLRRALPGASSNMVADRLRELVGHGVIERRVLPPPAAVSVYQLTERGRELEPVLLALGEWGVAEPRPAGPVSLSAASMLLYLRGSVDPGGRTYRVELDGRVWGVRGRAGTVVVEPGEPTAPAGAIRTDPRTLNELLDDPAALPGVVGAGRAEVDGDIRPLITRR